MLDKLLEMVRRYRLIDPGDTVICAVSGGADSVALLFALYLLREKLQLHLEAAHFNHGLRGDEALRDEKFVEDLCDRLQIPLAVGRGRVQAGEKGLEAAAREARYAFFATLPGKIATAHTADDNAETVLMHLVRGTGLRGLGGIAPRRGTVIRPLLLATRAQVLAFLEEYNLDYVTDSTNAADDFLRNRLRHHVLPLLRQENPRLAENLSAMALGLRQDEEALAQDFDFSRGLEIPAFRQLPPARQNRVMGEFLRSCGVKEPEAAHIRLAIALTDSHKPSAMGDFPGGVTLVRRYDRLTVFSSQVISEPIPLACPGQTSLPQLGLRVTCQPAEALENGPGCFTVCPQGSLLLRSRYQGDTMRLPGGSKSLKKLFIDRKIPACLRLRIPVICDEGGILGVWQIGVNEDRKAGSLPAVTVRIEETEKEITEEAL